MAVDGTKIRAQNNVKNNYNKKKLDRHIAYVEGKIEDYLNDWEEVRNSKNRGKKKELTRIEDKLEELDARLDNFANYSKILPIVRFKQVKSYG